MKFTTLPTPPSATKEGFSVAKHALTLFMAGRMSLIIPGSIHLLFLCHERHFMKFMTLYSVLAYPLRQ